MSVRFSVAERNAVPLSCLLSELDRSTEVHDVIQKHNPLASKIKTNARVEFILEPDKVRDDRTDG